MTQVSLHVLFIIFIYHVYKSLRGYSRHVHARLHVHFRAFIFAIGPMKPA